MYTEKQASTWELPCISHEAESLSPSVFSLSTQLLVVVARHRHTVGTHIPAAYSDAVVNTIAVPSTISAHGSTCPSWLSSINIIYNFTLELGYAGCIVVQKCYLWSC